MGERSGAIRVTAGVAWIGRESDTWRHPSGAARPGAGSRPAAAACTGGRAARRRAVAGPATGFGSRDAHAGALRFLRKARELAYRDLGGLVYNLHRFGQRNDPLVLDKLNTLGQIDRELRALEGRSDS